MHITLSGLIFLHSLFNLAIVKAFPTRPGRCRPGIAVGGSHNITQSGTITEGKYEILIHDEPLSASSSMNLFVNTTYTWEIRGMGARAFKGFLALFIQENGVDLTDALFIDPESDHLAAVYHSGTLPSCPIGSVAAGHTYKRFKNSVKGTITFDDIGKVDVHVTTVLQNLYHSNVWYYSNYTVNIVSGDIFITNLPPTPSPTKIIGIIPSYRPTAIITKVPSSLSLDQPDTDPTDQSLISFTNDPTNSQINETTSSPSEVPTFTPTKSPIKRQGSLFFGL